MRTTRTRPAGALLLPVFLLFVIACSSDPGPPPVATATATPPAAATASPTTVPAPPTPLPPTPTATPDPAVVDDGGVELVRRAYDILLALQIAEPAPATLLAAAWQGAANEAAGLGAASGDLTPALAGDADAAWAAFRASYLALLDRLPPERYPELRFAAQAAMARSLGDCHTFFLPPRRSEALADLRAGRGSVGIGVELAPLSPVIIREVIGGGPAAAAGVQVGDRVLAVDGEDVSTADLPIVDDRLRGEAGSTLSLSVHRAATGETLQFELTRALVEVKPVESELLANGLGYIRIRVFSAGTEVRELVAAALNGFEREGASAWIVDLRDNPGGDRDLTLYSYFVGAGVVERTLLRDGGLELKEAVGGAFPERPLAVLINGATASIAEIFTAMLQDYGRAQVFGTNSARCAGFVHIETLADGSSLGVTIARSLTPLGEQPLYATGVLPDVAVSQSLDDLAAGRDPVLEAAIDWLSR